MNDWREWWALFEDDSDSYYAWMAALMAERAPA